MIKYKNISLYWKRLTSLVLLLFTLHLNPINYTGTAQEKYNRSPQEQWVDSVYNHMSLDEKIGQLFMIRAHSNLGDDHTQSVIRQIEKYHVGGLCFFQGTPTKQAELVNQYQSITKLPLFISMDAEWGPAMRFSENIITYPRQLMLGAIQDNELIYEFGAEMARQLKLIGVNISFSPVSDINNNPKNPVINDRSFGEDKYNVTAKSYMLMKGIQENGVLACAKHFPGHGDTDVDSHYDLPVIKKDLAHLRNFELYPFAALAKTELAGMMIAHLNIPALDDRENIPTSLSHNTITNLLKDSLGFAGLIFTDGLEMQAVSGKWPNGITEVKAFEAGNDILLLPNDLPLAFEMLKEAITRGTISEQRLKESVKKILRYKYQLGLHTAPEPLNVETVTKEITNDQALEVKEKLIKNAITLVRDQKQLIPLNGQNDIISISLGKSFPKEFQQTLRKFSNGKQFQSSDPQQTKKIFEKLKNEDPNTVFLISLHDMGRFASSNFGLNTQEIDLINQWANENRVVLTVFGNPYSLSYFDNIETVIMGYHDDPMTQKAVAESIFGKSGFKGRLPVSASPISSYHQGITTSSNESLQFGLPESVGVDGQRLHRTIDSLVDAALFEEAMPGCQILIAKNNQIIFREAYGYHTYDKKRSTEINDLYDLASITKVVGATAAIMKLYENGHISLDEPIHNYLPEARGTDKADLTLRDIMAHRAGLRSWIPFYKETLDHEKQSRPSPTYYSNQKDEIFGLQVNEELFLRTDYADTIYQIILDTPLRNSKNYLYSDLGFILITKIVENVSGRPLNKFLHEEIFEPLNMVYTHYQPSLYFPSHKIAPTEDDTYFRFNRVQGHVHDMAAAMLDGISGHAGLFSNVDDLAIFFQMLLNEGTYNGVRIFRPSTIREFTSRHPKDKRRGIGFDMKTMDVPDSKTNIAPLASNETFGHYGFTGTAAWADPTYELIYIFLSNRTYPDYPNRPNLLHLHNYRENIQNAIYESMGLERKPPDISQ